MQNKPGGRSYLGTTRALRATPLYMLPEARSLGTTTQCRPSSNTKHSQRKQKKKKKKKYRGEEGMAVKADHRTAGVSSPVCARPRVGSVQPNDNTACGSPHSDSTPPSNVNMSKGRTRNRQSPKAGDSPGALAAVLLSWGQCRCSLPGVPPEPFKNQALQGLSRVPCGSGTEVCTEAESWS